MRPPPQCPLCSGSGWTPLPATECKPCGGTGKADPRKVRRLLTMEHSRMLEERAK